MSVSSGGGVREAIFLSKDLLCCVCSYNGTPVEISAALEGLQPRGGACNLGRQRICVGLKQTDCVRRQGAATSHQNKGNPAMNKKENALDRAVVNEEQWKDK